MMTTIIYQIPKVMKKAIYNLTKMLAKVTLTMRFKTSKCILLPMDHRTFWIITMGFIQELSFLKCMLKNTFLIYYSSMYTYKSILKILLTPLHRKYNASNPEICILVTQDQDNWAIISLKSDILHHF